MNVCVFCSSSDAIEQLYFKQAEELGKLLANNNFKLIHGGGGIGLMGETSRTVKQNGGSVTGVIPEKLNLRGIASPVDDEIIVTPDMKERKATMHKLSDAFIALPGGFGTLEELLEVITLKQLKYHQKAIIIINTNEFYKHLIAQFNHMFSERFSKAEFKDLYFVASNPVEAIEYLKSYNYVDIKDKWF